MEDLARRITSLSPEKRLLLELQIQIKKGLPEPIAIVGLGCRLPGANNPHDYWNLLVSGQDAIREVPGERWSVDQFYDADPQAPGKHYCRWGGFLDQIDQFEPEFFGIAPREAAFIDPQQRLFLEVLWEALEDAGIVPQQLSGSQTGVFAGVSTLDYGQLLLQGAETIDTYTTTGLASTMVANRVSYLLNFRGPSLTVDTACSSSLVAVNLACQSLWSGETSLALAGGVNLILTPSLTIGFSKLTALSPDGRCKAFDAKANGFVRSEGAGVVVLKRLSQAIEDGDHIYALIRGGAVNQDGRSNGLTAPNREAQEQVLRDAYQRARVPLQDVRYIEAHGTGTLLGDPIEAKALGNVFGVVPDLPQPIRIGSVKSNIGHTEAAAGIASLIKVALALKHRTLVPSLHFQTPNPYIPFADLPLHVQTAVEPWPDFSDKVVAGVSSFGFGGTNAHMVLQAPPQLSRVKPERERPYHVLTLSARNERALKALAGRYATTLSQMSPSALGDFCYTANTGRTGLSHRLAVYADSPKTLQQSLTALANGDDFANRLPLRSNRPSEAPGVVWLFTGQGSQYPDMGRQLYDTQPVFRQTLERCAELLAPHLDVPLLSLLYPDSETDTRLHQTAYTQPALFALEYALATLWQSWGVEPAAVLGHSIGEYVAACVAGVMTLEDGLKLIARRGRLMQSLPENGAMAAIFADEATVADAIAPYGEDVAIATLNSPQNTVIAGLKASVEAVLAALSARKIRSQPLTVSHAFHSPLMDPILNLFEHMARQISFKAPTLPFASNVTGQLLAPGVVPDAAYWRQHARSAVRFADGLAALRAKGYTHFLEIGPHPVLTGLAKHGLPEEESLVCLPSLRRGQEDWPVLLQSLSRLYVDGVPIDWAAFDRPYSRRRCSLPTYPFQRQRYWVDVPTPFGISHSPTPAEFSQTPFYQVTWHAQPLGSTRFDHQGQWLVFSDQTGLGDALVAQIRARGGQAVTILPGERFSALSPDQYQVNPQSPEDFQKLIASLRSSSQAIGQTVYLWSLDQKDGAQPQSDYPACLSLLALLKALVNDPFPSPARLWLVTRAAQEVPDRPVSLEPWQAALWGLGRTLRWEHPDLWGGLVDVEIPPATQPTALAEGLLAHVSQSSGEDEAAFRSGQRYVARLEPVTAAPPAAIDPPIKANATYLITGGTGALGRAVTRWLVDQGARNLVLVSRQGWPSSHAPQLEALQDSGVTLWVEQVDVANPAQVEALLQRLRQHLPPLKGVLHAAGALSDSTLLNLTASQFAQVMAPKVQGAWNLHQATLADSLDWFVLFSSIASLLGSPGQANYGAANACLDALAAYRQQQGLPAQSLSWGPWAGEGMAQVSDTKGSLRGVRKLETQRALVLLQQSLSMSQGHLGVAEVEWDTVKDSIPFAIPPLLHPVLAPSATEQAGSAVQDLAEAPHRSRLPYLLSLEDKARKAELIAYFQREVGRVLELSDAAPIDRPLLDLGLDSLMTVDLLNLCRRDLQITLYPREILAHPTIQSLASYVSQELIRLHSSSVSVEEASDLTVSEGSDLSQGFWSSQPLLTPPEQRNRSMLFLLSSPRAGSTLLRVMLAGHPDLFCPPELHLLPFDTLGERHAALGGSYLEEGLQRALMELMQLDADATQALLADWREHNTPIQAIYDKLQQLAGNRLLVDKSPTYSLSLGALQRAEQLFENAKFIHLVRHPYAVVDSFVKNRMHKIFNLEPDDPYRLAEQVWDVSNRNIRTFLQGVEPQRQHVLRYEDLVSNPEEAMRQLCAFLEVPFDPAVLTPYEGKRMTDGVRANSMAVDDPNFRQRQRIESALAEAWRSVDLPMTLTPATQALATDFDYELPREFKPFGMANSAAVLPPPGDPLTTMDEQTVVLRGLETCLCTWGPADGPVILCLHGILEQGAAWDAIASSLAQQGYRVIAPDLRGHGRSAHIGPDGTYQLLDFLGDIDALLRQLPSAPMTLVGHSMGAILAATLASLRPDRFNHLVLVEPVVPGSGSPEAVTSQLEAHLTYLAQPPKHSVLTDVQAAAARLRQYTPALSEQMALKLAARISEPYQGGVRWRWDARLQTRTSLGLGGGALSRQQYGQLLQRIQAPTLLIYGDSSQFNRPEDLALQQESLPRARRVILEGGHHLPVEVPASIAALIFNHLSEKRHS